MECICRDLVRHFRFQQERYSPDYYDGPGRSRTLAQRGPAVGRHRRACQRARLPATVSRSESPQPPPKPGRTVAGSLQWPAHRDSRRPAVHLDANVCRNPRHCRRGQLQRHELGARSGGHLGGAASTGIKGPTVFPEPPMNQVGIQPASQRYRRHRCAVPAAGLNNLGPQLRAVLAPRNSLRLHSVHLFPSWTRCSPPLPHNSRCHG